MEIGTTLFSEEERAVSPVIGVILMVAITVILAAVIAAFVLGMGPGGDPVQGAVDISGDNSSTVSLTVTDGGQADQLVVAQNGFIQADGVTAATGASYTVGSGEDIDVAAGTYDVYLVNGDMEDGQAIDDADGNLHIGQITVT